MQLPFSLWTRKVVKELIAQKYGVVLAIRTIGKYLIPSLSLSLNFVGISAKTFSVSRYFQE
ncbi:MAG: winged helix-turn-helix domain-containing protein [Bacteroidales bacterium]|nr:winged helix-turn-helix domain-containing protein [Bacteroidales bacterium]